MNPETVFSVSQFVGVLNQILETALPFVYVQGEVSNYQVRAGKWVSFKLKDNDSIVECFGSIWQINTPIEDGMEVVVAARPQLSGKWGKFSLSLQSVKPLGEGGLLRSLQLLAQKLESEGLFDESRKRPLPPYPKTIGVVSSPDADGYKDFVRIAGERWPLAELVVSPTLVQGDSAPTTIEAALQRLTNAPHPPEVIAMVRGGGSSEDLMAFSAEPVVRAVAECPVPIVVGVGHQADVSLSQLAADKAAATPTHAAQLICPDYLEVRAALERQRETMALHAKALIEATAERQRQFERTGQRFIRGYRQRLVTHEKDLLRYVERTVGDRRRELTAATHLLEQFNPQAVLSRGYAMVRTSGKIITLAQDLQQGDRVELNFKDGSKGATIS